jgi:hypothetical protein
MRVWLAIFLLGLGACSSGDQGEVSARLEALEARMDRLEGMGGSAVSAAGSVPAVVGAVVAGEALSESGAALPDGEEGARVLFREARKHSRKLETTEALQRLATLQTHFPGTESAKRANRMKRDLGTVGTAVSSLDVKTWYQGTGDDLNLVTGTTLLLFADVSQADAADDIASIKALAGEYEGKVQLVALVRGEKPVTEDQAMAFVAANKLTASVGQSTKAIKELFQVKGTPSVALVKGGVVVWKGMVGELDQGLLERVL